MTCVEFYQLMADPVRLSEKTIPDLQQIVVDFPFFHAARMLYLKKMAVTKDVRLPLELKKTAIHIPDRVKLYMLIEGDLTIDQISANAEQADTVKDAEVDSAKTNNLINTLPEESLDYESKTLASGDYMLLSEDNNSRPAVALPTLQHQDLIDSFIQSEQTRSHSRILFETEKTGIVTDDITKDQEKSEKTLEDVYFTETLANIYIKQKRYDKALEIIKQLSLKYPKKNIYFADQIRYLEKLIIHIKK